MMRDDHEDAPPCAEVELSTERPDTLPPDTDRELSLADVMRALGEVRVAVDDRIGGLETQVDALKAKVGQYQEHVTLLLSATEIHEIQRELRLNRIDENVIAVRTDLGVQLSGIATLLDEKFNGFIAELDRQSDRRMSAIEGKATANATIVTGHSHSIHRAHERIDAIDELEHEHAANGNGNGNGHAE